MLPDILGNIVVFEVSPGLPVCPSDKSRIKIKMIVKDLFIMKDWYSETDRGKLKYTKKYQFHVVQQIFNVDWPGFETGTPRWVTANWPPISRLNHGMATKTWSSSK